MPDRIPKLVAICGLVFAPLMLAFLALTRPGYFTSQIYLGGLFLLEFLFAALWMYRRVFFPLVIVAFLLAGVNLPLYSFWVAGRWVFLGVGALAGAVIMLKDRNHRIGGFHALAIFTVLSGLVSAAVCRYTGFSLLKVLSLLLLFAYTATGARLAVAGRESRFFSGLLTGCEIFVGATTLFYLAGIEIMGNPNSLGAVMGVVAAPILLWGGLLDDSPPVRHRRFVFFGIAMFLVFYSESRAGIVAGTLACGLLCVALRRYKLLAQGVCLILILVAASSILDPQVLPSIVDSILYKGKDPTLGVLHSRESPWEGAEDSIRKHPWFGSGFGVTDNGQDASSHLSTFETNESISRENGSSYLTILTWVGFVGVAPFLLLLLAVLLRVVRTLLWMLNTGSPSHPAVPLAIVIFAALIHAGFEDWLFAPGYYLCVFFWSLAFILVDFAPWVPLPSFSAPWRPRVARVSSFSPIR